MTIINFLTRGTKLANFAMHVESAASACLFSKWISHLISKTFVYEFAWYQKVFQIVTHQPRGTNVLFLKVIWNQLQGSANACTLALVTEREGERERERERRLTWRGKFFQKYIFFSLSACYTSKCLEIFRLSKSLSKKESSELIVTCACVIQRLWYVSISFFLHFMFLWLIAAVYYKCFFLFSFFMRKTKGMSSKRSLTRTTGVFCNRHIFGSLAVPD